MLASRTDAVLQALGLPLNNTLVNKRQCSQQSEAPRGDFQDPGTGRDDKTRSALVRETSRKPLECYALDGQPLWNIDSLRAPWDSE